VAFVVRKFLGLLTGTTLARKVVFSAVWSFWYASVIFRLNVSSSASIALSYSVFVKGITVGDILMAEIVFQGVFSQTLIAFSGCFAVVCFAPCNRLMAEIVLERVVSEAFLADSDILTIIVGRAVFGLGVASVVDQHVAALT